GRSTTTWGFARLRGRPRWSSLGNRLESSLADQSRGLCHRQVLDHALNIVRYAPSGVAVKRRRLLALMILLFAWMTVVTAADALLMRSWKGPGSQARTPVVLTLLVAA